MNSSTPSASPLDYAVPIVRPRRSPAQWPPLRGLILAVATALLLAAFFGAKMVPGGPFISVLGDLLPCLICCGVIASAWRSLRHGPTWRRLLVVLILPAAALINLVAAGVVSFWVRPYARGSLIGL